MFRSIMKKPRELDVGRKKIDCSGVCSIFNMFNILLFRSILKRDFAEQILQFLGEKMPSFFLNKYCICAGVINVRVR